MDKHAIIKLKEKGKSNRKTAKLLDLNRKTIAKYWNEYLAETKKLSMKNIDNKSVQEKICSDPIYDISKRKARKYNQDMNLYLGAILESEVEKCKELGVHKQQPTNIQIHQLMIENNFDISYSTISNKIREKRNKSKECFIKQNYNFGDRLEYDFGEVKLLVDGQLNKFYLAVLSSPASNFRWAFLYKTQKQDVFMNSHVEFFEMLGGVYKEVVYDNMKNVVTKFIGRNEKVLNKELVKLSLYYGYDINVTNCFSGNEKGHVEGSVKVIRNQVFAIHYKFKNFEDAREHLQQQLKSLNKNSTILEEKKHLLQYKPKLDLANITYQKVNKYSFIRINNNHYSVPEYLVDKKITAKTYYDKIHIYANNIKVCEHKKKDGENKITIDIRHYLKSLNRKPGAIKNSLALKSIPCLKNIFDKFFISNPKKFVEILQKNNDKSIEELVNIFKSYTHLPIDIISANNSTNQETINIITKKLVSKYNDLCIGRP